MRLGYRAHVFAQDRTKSAFLKCLDEAGTKAGWVVHASWRQLNMGSPFRLSRLVSAAKAKRAHYRQWAQQIAKCKV